MKLWLDDVRPTPDGWRWCMTVDCAKAHLLTGEVEEASLDHDMGPGEPTGYDLVKWMAEHNIWPRTKPRVHSANPAGAEYMRGVIDRYWAPPGEDRR